MPELIHGPLEGRHHDWVRFLPKFGGWLMPASYAGTVSERALTPPPPSYFDVSHLGKALVRGPGAAQFVRAHQRPGSYRAQQAQYALCCTESGGVIDGLIACTTSGDDEVFLGTSALIPPRWSARLAAACGRSQAICLHRSCAVLTVQGAVFDRRAHRVGLPTEMDYMGYAETHFVLGGTGACLSHRLHQ